ncbi:unnamed protein product, partial [Ectocarpus sp. 12 AP-2014]
ISWCRVVPWVDALRLLEKKVSAAKFKKFNIFNRPCCWCWRARKDTSGAPSPALELNVNGEYGGEAEKHRPREENLSRGQRVRKGTTVPFHEVSARGPITEKETTTQLIETRRSSAGVSTTIRRRRSSSCHPISRLRSAVGPA